MSAESIHLTGEKETLLITLYARALDAREPHPLLGDRKADEIVHRIDYDFEKLRLHTGDRYSLTIRAKHLDHWTRDFLAFTSDATVVHLGCGLDSRALRVAPSEGVHWFDLDQPEVIDIRRRFYEDRPGYKMIAAQVTDPDWLEQISTDHPVMIIAEGLLMYLTPDDVTRLFERITSRFPSGEIIFDAISPLAGRLVPLKPAFRHTGAAFRWLPEDPRDLGRVNPRLDFVEDQPIVGLPDVAQMPWPLRLICEAMNCVPMTRNLMRLVRYRF